ncbi:MAG: metallophosphoesterase family protein [Lachnospiraceae bacterium]
MTRVAIISDTHDFVSPMVLERVKTCDYLLHAGDICHERYADMFRMNCKHVYFVKGNNDRESWCARLSKSQRFTIEKVTFFMVHDWHDMGRDAVKKMIGAQVIITGHTHIYKESYTPEGVLLLNPGSCSISRTGQNTLAIMTIHEDGTFEVEKILL